MAEPIRKPEPDAEPGINRETSIIGKPFRRVDGRAKVTGATKFADDLSFPRMCHVRLVRSHVPHALIVSIDVYEAALKVKVEYEPLATISSIEEALATPEPRIHDYGDHGNVHKAVAMTFGDVEKGFAEADEIFEDVFFYEGNTHLPMEQHSAVAVPEDDDRVTLYSSTQTPHYVHRALSKVLGLPASRVRVIACSNGGGFGGKSDPFNHEIVAAKAALKLGRPVKAALDREEVFYCHRGRHPVLMQLT